MEVDRASVEQLAVGYKRQPIDPFNFILSLHFVKVTDGGGGVVDVVVGGVDGDGGVGCRLLMLLVVNGTTNTSWDITFLFAYLIFLVCFYEPTVSPSGGLPSIVRRRVPPR